MGWKEDGLMVILGNEWFLMILRYMKVFIFVKCVCFLVGDLVS